jgi:hypothetical protein
LTRVMIDRGVGVAVLFAFTSVILLLPSELTAPLGCRDLVLVLFGAVLTIGSLVLVSTPRVFPLLERWR